MKKNIGVLSMNNQYTFIGCTDNGEDYSACENCGKLIRYVVHLIDKTGKSYYVGTECAKTLAEANISNAYSMGEQIKELKKCAEVKKLITGTHQIWGYAENFCIVGIIGKQVKKIKISPVYDLFGENRLQFVDTLILELTSICKIWNDWCYNDVFKYYDQCKDSLKK